MGKVSGVWVDWRESSAAEGVIYSDAEEFTSSNPRVYSHFGMRKFQESNGKKCVFAQKATA